MIVLASGSATRRAMLERAGVAFVVDSTPVDEEAVKRAMAGSGADAADCALALAELKAVGVSGRRPGTLVVGADQMLECEGRWFDKPADRLAARAQLLDLAGRTHRLVSAAVAVKDGARVWQAVDRAQMTMRPFDADFVETYLDRAGAAATSSVGAYQIEGLGVQLFSAVEGDHFTILGLPLLPLLDFLRREGEIEA